MATADDELTTDISIEGDPEEIDRFRKVSLWQVEGVLAVLGIGSVSCLERHDCKT